MNIVYAADNNYAWLAGISLLSFLDNNKGIHNIFILDDNILVDNKNKLKEIASKYQANIFFIDVKNILNDLKEKGVKGYGDHLSLAIYARLFIADLLPQEVKKVLYLDCDTLIVDDISEIENIKMNKTMMMVPDCLHSAYKNYINLSKEKVYYNSGVILFDLKKWRMQKCTNQLMECLENKSNTYALVDQDTISVSLNDEIERFSVGGYNCQSMMFLYDYDGCLKVYDLNESIYLNENEFNITKNHPKILHFCGNSFIRPWYSNSNHLYKEEWLRYYKESPWCERKLIPYKSGFLNSMRYNMYKFLPMKANVFFSRIGQRLFIKFRYKV